MSEQPPEPGFYLPPAAPPAGQPMAPPVGPLQLPTGDPNKAKKRGAIGTLLLAIGAKIKTFFAFILPALKFLKLGKVLLTSGTMLISIVWYAQLFGWPLAALFVFGILIHELGHVFVAWLCGIKVSAPMFIPGMGALILSNDPNETIWQGALIGIGGPLAGALAAGAFWLTFKAVGNPVFLAAAYITFFMNLFNLTPVFPLDGGWIVKAINVWLWVIGLVLLLVMVVSGMITNPMIYVLLLLSAPNVYMSFKNRKTLYTGKNAITKDQKVMMGCSYVALVSVLVICMARSHEALDSGGTLGRAQSAKSQPQNPKAQPY